MPPLPAKTPASGRPASRLPSLCTRATTHAPSQYVLIDDGWTGCLRGGGDAPCEEPAPRGADGRIPINRTKFPEGFRPLTAYLRSLGLRAGIYTAVGARTCGGFVGSLGHEAVDAAAFAEWGFEFVKHDTCDVCGLHDRCIQNATARMHAALNATGIPIVYYIDAGNPTALQRVFNPHQHHVVDPSALDKLAVKPSELVWWYARDSAHMVRWRRHVCGCLCVLVAYPTAGG